MTCGYLRDHISILGYDKTVEEIITSLHNIDFDTIVVTGVSGLLFGPTIAHKLGKKLVIVRKENDSSHSKERIEGELLDGAKFVILDDLVDTTNSLLKMLDAVNKRGENVMFVGIYLYASGYFTDMTTSHWFYKVGKFLDFCDYITYIGASEDSRKIFEFAMKIRAIYEEQFYFASDLICLGIDNYSNALQIWAQKDRILQIKNQVLTTSTK